MLKNTNKLYGASDDCSSIHEIDIPFLINTDLEFRLDSIDKNTIMQHESYFIPDRFPWVIIPSYYWDMYIGGDIVSKYDEESDIFILYDKTTKQPIEQIQMYKRRVISDSARNSFIQQLSAFLNRLSILSTPIIFNNMESHPVIRKAYDNKVSMGRFLVRLTKNDIDILLYFFKGLFSLNKSDTLDIEIRFDCYNKHEFMATYKPMKKKNPLTFNRYGVSFSEKIHCMYINMA